MNCQYEHEGMCIAQEELETSFKCRFDIRGKCMARDGDLLEFCCECEKEPVFRDGYCKRCYYKYFGDESTFSKRASKEKEE